MANLTLYPILWVKFDPNCAVAENCRGHGYAFIQQEFGGGFRGSGGVCTTSHASTISIYSTGVDDSGNALAVGANDTHYSGGPTSVYENSAYLANDAVGTQGSAWLGGDPFPGTVEYTVHFNLASVGNAILSGFWSTDNQGLDILINGHSTGLSLPGVVFENFTQLNAFTTTLAQAAFFQLGDNTLTFRVQNDGGPGAFRTAGLNVATTPIPPALLLFITALGGIGFVGYRKRRASAAA